MLDHIDGVIEPGREERLLRHLGSCEDCRAEYELLCRLDTILAESSVERAPARLVDAVVEEVSLHARRLQVLERVWVLAGVPIGLVSVGVAVRAVITAERGLGTTAAGALSGLSAPLVEGLSARVVDFGPDVQGVIWALAAAALSLLAVTALRLSRERALGWN